MKLLPAVALVFTWGCHCNSQGYREAQDLGDMSYLPAPRAPFDRALVSACGAGGFSELGSRGFERRPYLQLVGSDTASVLFTSSAAARFDVRVTTPGGELVSEAVAIVDESASLPSGEQYIATLTGLQADAIHCYEILADGEPWLDRTGLKTAPSKGQMDRAAFVALGDLGASQPDQFFVRDQLRTVEADFALIAGDVGYDDGELEHFEENFFAVYEPWLRQVPVFPASGNHDYRCDDARVFREVFALPENGGPAGIERWYSHDWGDIHFVMLDTEEVGAEQVAWLDADLAANDSPWTIAVLHRPPFSSGSHGSKESVREAFVPIFEKHGLTLALSGHDHHYERTVPINGVTYVVTGGGGRGTRAHDTSEFTAFAERVAHFVYIVIEGTELTLFAIDATGQVFDTARLSRE